MVGGLGGVALALTGGQHVCDGVPKAVAPTHRGPCAHGDTEDENHASGGPIQQGFEADQHGDEDTQQCATADTYVALLFIDGRVIVHGV